MADTNNLLGALNFASGDLIMSPVTPLPASELQVGIDLFSFFQLAPRGTTPPTTPDPGVAYWGLGKRRRITV